MGRDRTDVVSWGAAAVAALGIAAVFASGGSGADPAVRPEARVAATAAGGAGLAARLDHWPPVAGDAERLKEMAASAPGDASALLALGDLARGGGRLDEAASWYRRALKADRSVVDRNSPGYAGERFSRLIDEGLPVYLREREVRPGDGHVREVIEDLYLLRRALAGGCD